MRVSLEVPMSFMYVVSFQSLETLLGQTLRALLLLLLGRSMCTAPSESARAAAHIVVHA